MKHWLLSVLLVVCGTVSAQITLVKDGKSSARIIVQDKMPNSKTSAQFLQRFLTEISGVALPIENDKTPRFPAGNQVVTVLGNHPIEFGNFIRAIL